MLLPKNPTLSEWASYWLETYVKPVAKPSGYEHYHDNLHKHILPKLGRIRLTRLTTPTVQTFLNEAAEHGNLRTGGPLSPKSIKNMRVVLDVCCKRAVADGYMPANPIPATVYKHCSTHRVDVLSDPHQKTLEEWLFQDLSLQNAGIIQGLYSGMRLGEVCALRWKHFDPQRGSIYVSETVRRVSNYKDDATYGSKTHLVFSDAKTDSSKRTLYLPSILLSLLSFQYERFSKLFGHEPTPEDFIFFNSKGGLMDPDNLSHYFGDVLDGLGLPHVKFHALRHTFATRAVENGVDVATVSGLLGHADVTTTTHYYVHPREEAMRRAMAAVTPVTATPMYAPEKVSFASLVQQTPEPVRPNRVCRRRRHFT